jgi:hypothetical protein
LKGKGEYMNNIIVYGASFDRACHKLQIMLEDMRYGDVEEVKRNKDIFTVRLKNGDYYKALGASDNARGHRWQYAFIDRLISEEILNNVVYTKYIPNQNEVFANSDNIRDRMKWF